MRRIASTGVTLSAVLPWVVALVGVLLASVAWLPPRQAMPVAGGAPSAEPAEIRSLRLALATSTAENGVLRQELDRLIARSSAGGAAPDVPRAPDAVTAEPSATPSEELRALTGHLSETLSRAAAGDSNAAREAAMTLLQALKGGPAAFGALRDTYLNTADPKARAMLLPSMIFGGGADAREFVVSEVQRETDPDLHRTLLTQAAGFATPQNAEALKGSFLQALGSEADPPTRTAAIRGLRYARGSEVQDALVAAAADPSEEIRLAAIQGIAARPAMREQLRSMIASDPSNRVREIGDCRLLLAENGG